MRVLFVTPYLPAPPDFGGAIRMYHLIREAARAHEVAILSLAGPGDDPALSERELGPTIAVPVPWTGRQPPSAAKRLGQLRSLFSLRSAQYRQMVQPALQAALDRLLRERPVDLVQLEFSLTGLYRLPRGIPTVLDVHNVEHDLVRQVARRGSPARRWFNAVEWRKLRRDELEAWRRASACLATSAADGRTIESATGRPAVIIPNGIDPDRLPRSPLALGRPERLLFVGTLRYWPNAEGVRFFVIQVLPCLRDRIPGIEFVVAGADPSPDLVELAREPGVRLVGRVPDTRPWLEQAGVVVVPLLSGSGTRLKVLEAFAAGRPVVSTRLGAAGLGVEDGVHLLLADSPEEMAAAIARLVQSPELRERLVENAWRLVDERYRWTTIGQRLLETYDGLWKEALPSGGRERASVQAE
jgi:glycosyltransferase involved in cell wall biosynthesis